MLKSPSPARRRGALAAAAAGALAAAAALAVAGAPAVSAATQRAAPGALRVQRILSGQRLRHSFPGPGASKPRSAPLTQPDDLTALGRDLFTAFQNGVGPQGQAAPGGNVYSTIVEFSPAGRPLQQWDIMGHCDGLTADPVTRRVIATVNEDAHSSVYTIAPLAPAGEQVLHFRYSIPLPGKGGTDPLPGKGGTDPLPGKGGTGAISIYHGQVLISASAPGTTGRPAPQPGYPAAYRVRLEPAIDVAVVRPLFSAEARARLANAGHPGQVVKLALTDPDSNAVVPPWAPRFGGYFELTSQGGKEQVFSRPGGPGGLQVLRLSQSVDDAAWPLGGPGGRLYAADPGGDTIDLVTGHFTTGSVLAAVTPCDANGAPANCPAKGYPANYLGRINPWTGRITRVTLTGAALHPAGLKFLVMR